MATSLPIQLPADVPTKAAETWIKCKSPCRPCQTPEGSSWAVADFDTHEESGVNPPWIIAGLGDGLTLPLYLDEKESVL